MSGSRAPVFFGLVVLLAAGAVAWMVLGGRGTEPAAPPGGTPGTAGGKGAPGAGKGAARPPVVMDPAVPATREGCLAFLREMAGPLRPRPSSDGASGMVYLYPEVRADALEALAAADPEGAEPLVLAALGGDTDPEDWSEDRLAAAVLRIRAGKPDGAATVRSFLLSHADLADAEGLARLAEAASWMGGEEGGNAVRRLLAVPADSWSDEEDLAAVLRAAATLGTGASHGELRRFVDAAEGTWEPVVLGAAAGALLRLGDDHGRKVMEALAAEDWFEGEEFAAGLAARGNAAALPWLETILSCDQEWSRAAAARALRAVGDPAALPALRRALGDADADVRAEASVALLALGDPAGLPGTLEATGNRDEEIAVPAWRALALAGSPEGRGAAEALLGTPRLPPTDPRWAGPARARIWAAALLLKLGVR